MSSEKLIIPLADYYKSIIIQAICDGNKKDIEDFNKENNLYTSNNIHMLKWDFINTNLAQKLRGEKFVCYKVKRGIWQFVLIHDIENNVYYSLMNEKNLLEIRENVQKRFNKSVVHYLDALAYINNGIKPIVERDRQGKLFIEDTEAWEDQVSRVLEQITSGITTQGAKYVLISFATRALETISVLAQIPTQDLGIAHIEDWSEFIAPDFAAVIDRNTSQEDDEDEVKISIRDHVLNRNSEIKVNVRRDEVEKTDK